MIQNTLVLRVAIRILQRLHSSIVETIRFHHVNDIESVLLVLPGVRHRKVEPLRMRRGEIIWLQYQIVFIIASICVIKVCTSRWPSVDYHSRIDSRRPRWYHPTIMGCRRVAHPNPTIMHQCPWCRDSNPHNQTPPGWWGCRRNISSQFLVLGSPPR